MKKSKTLKLATGLLILCLITTCVIGTTLAKYTTGGNASDTARVAKWGVSVNMNADPLFKNEYSKTDNAYSGSLSVKSSSTGTNIVAPGTNSEQVNGSAIFSISGTPEVATRITLNMSDVQDVVLKAGTYKDPTAANGTFTLASDYCPVVFTLKQTFPGTNKSAVTLVTGTLTAVKGYLDNYNKLGADGQPDNNTDGREYAPNTDLSSTFELSWDWAFEGGNDKADTYLGNLMAGQNPDSLATSSYCLNVAYTLTVTVTQVD